MAALDPVSAIAAVEEPALHIPDGFVSAPVAAVGWVATAAVVAFAVRRVDRRLEERAVPLMGVMTAFIFVAQMVNFPIAGGTSGHLVGGALAAILLFAAALQLALYPALPGVHALIGIGEGLISVGALALVRTARPDLLAQPVRART